MHADACTHYSLQELQEETSVSSVQLLAEAQRWLTYDFPPEVRARLGSSWAHYKGQAQRWFLFKFTGDDSGEARRWLPGVVAAQPYSYRCRPDKHKLVVSRAGDGSMQGQLFATCLLARFKILTLTAPQASLRMCIVRCLAPCRG
eukprot:GHRQ01029579.1.p2 GENE.GHRQ01029579.1~~GHRQ01029579.1.p2  ORF type:complete len:145 (+),score=29.04 GHRQ01029579.1:37-471(+)